ncbi:MAG: NADH-quinone oxidoreductase subunit H [Spirochaetota bacterium]|nr:MAG: NADH-quinone oxidoreductase subunit H [Spirochaetota bacterium]
MYIVYLIVYGFILTAVLGLVASWVDRKVTARVQYRKGPPFFQPWYDIIKLLGKETIIPKQSSKAMFVMAPLLGFSAVVMVSTLLWANNNNLFNSFLGDIIVIVYLLAIPSIAIMMGGFASGNPLARIGASREMKLLLGYELPFILAILVPIIKSGFSLKLADILSFQAQNGAFALQASGILALVVLVLCVQAKLGLVPFDIPEAETEIIAGPLVEYSGAGLAVFRLMKHMLLFTLPFFLIILFLGGMKFEGITILYSVLKYVAILVVITVIRNTNPRLRIDQAMRFFWGPVTGIAVIAVVLAVIGW